VLSPITLAPLRRCPGSLAAEVLAFSHAPRYPVAVLRLPSAGHSSWGPANRPGAAHLEDGQLAG